MIVTTKLKNCFSLLEDNKNQSETTIQNTNLFIKLSASIKNFSSTSLNEGRWCSNEKGFVFVLGWKFECFFQHTGQSPERKHSQFASFSSGVLNPSLEGSLAPYTRGLITFPLLQMSSLINLSLKWMWGREVEPLILIV